MKSVIAAIFVFFVLAISSAANAFDQPECVWTDTCSQERMDSWKKQADQEERAYFNKQRKHFNKRFPEDAVIELTRDITRKDDGEERTYKKGIKGIVAKSKYVVSNAIEFKHCELTIDFGHECQKKYSKEECTLTLRDRSDYDCPFTAIKVLSKPDSPSKTIEF